MYFPVCRSLMCVDVEIGALCLLVFWLSVFINSSISMHEYYRIKLANAFYHPDAIDIRLQNLPDRPKLLVCGNFDSNRTS